jgi:alkylation response protein AidB-like acyl-CoA dehydrogenase
MPSYKAPLDDMRFVLNEVINLSQVSSIPGFESVDTDTVNTMLSTVAKFAEEVLFPLNAVGDRQGCVLDRDTKKVKTPDGFKEAYEQFCANGLPMTSCDPAYGGMGMPVTMNTALGEMFCSSNIAFGMYPGLSHGAYNAIHEYGTDEQKQTYLPKLVTGEWTGTMCLTEPQCGTDLGLIKSKAVKQADGSYAITGTKIFISAGEHEMSSNILHLVLARIEDASTPPGIKGISLFVVPKFLPSDNSRNPVFCNRLEEKMGIHGNSTCEIGLENAKGWLIGEAHKGMKAMFVMMNEARLGVGLQGLGLSEVAYQNAVTYALDRIQSPRIDQKQGGKEAPVSVAIINHPDVRRELLTIKAQAEGARMLAYWTAFQLDLSQKHPDEAVKKRAKKILDLLTPIVKAHMTDNAETNTSAAIQVFGGHGYIKEHGMEQFYRDARITRLYEGTNGIQSLDLIMRKVLLSREGLLSAYLSEVKSDLKKAKAAGVPCGLRWRVKQASCMLRAVTVCLQAKGLYGKLTGKTGKVALDAASAATDYLKLASLVAMGHMWVKMATVATLRLKESPENKDFYETKLATARFYMAKVMPQMHAHAKTMKTGSATLMEIDAAQFARQQGTVAEKAWSASEAA